MGRMVIQDWDGAAHAVQVDASDFVVATAAAADIHEFTALTALLRRVHRAFGIDAVFVSEWIRGEPLVRNPEERAATEALQAMYGLRLLGADGPVARQYHFEWAPVATAEGGHGTLCCRFPLVALPDGAARQEAPRAVAGLIAHWFEQALQSAAG